MVNYAQKISLARVLLEDLELPDPIQGEPKMDLPALVESVRESVYFFSERLDQDGDPRSKWKV
jgi:hypothetical protein